MTEELKVKRKLWVFLLGVILLVGGIIMYPALYSNRGTALRKNSAETRTSGNGTDEGQEPANASGYSQRAQRQDFGPGSSLHEPRIIDYQPLPLDRPFGDMAGHDMNKSLAATHFLQEEAPKDCPRIDFRFFKPGEDGQMIPARIKRIHFWPFDPKQEAKVELIEGAELPGIGYQAPVGLLRLYIVREMTEKQRYMALKMGRTYYVEVYEHLLISFREQLREGMTGRGSTFVTIPEDVPPGKVLVVDVDVTATNDEWRITEDMVSARVTMRIPDHRGRPLQAFYYDFSTKRMKDSDMFRTGKFTWAPRSLKGELGLFDGKRGYCVYYRRGLKKELRFPEHAHKRLRAGQVRHFRVRAQKQVPKNTIGGCLLRRKDSPLPLALGRFLGIEEATRKAMSGAEMEFYGPPGTHRVAYVVDDDSLKVEPWGVVTVPQSPRGKVLLVQPLP
jgi:hypothetical protein